MIIVAKKASEYSWFDRPLELLPSLRSHSNMFRVLRVVSLTAILSYGIPHVGCTYYLAAISRRCGHVAESHLRV